MKTKFNDFIKESIFTDEELDALYKDSDNADMYGYDDVPTAKYKQNKTIRPKIDNNTAVYTKERIKTILKMVNLYPEYYTFVNNIYMKMMKNNWEVITVPDNIDVTLSKYNAIGNLPERDRFKFLNVLKNIKLFNIKEKSNQ